MLIVSNLSYSYTVPFSTKKREALRDLSFGVDGGEAFGFLGHNGAGKTTTIKCILGLVRPTSGMVTIGGLDSRKPRAREIVGYVPEHPYFYDHLSVSEAVEMYARLAGVSRTDVRARAARALERLGISDRAKNRMRTLSKGLVQRVAMTQAIVANPKLLILDEPFSGLDPIGRREFRELILDLKRQGTTILMSSHVLSDVERICDRASILVEGDLKGIFDLKNLPQLSSATIELVVSSSGSDSHPIEQLAKSTSKEAGASRMIFDERVSAEKALSKCLELGLEVVSYSAHRGSLEDLFTHLVSASKRNA